MRKKKCGFVDEPEELEGAVDVTEPPRVESPKQMDAFVDFLNKWATESNKEVTFYDLPDRDRKILIEIRDSGQLNITTKEYLLNLLEKKKVWVSHWKMIARELKGKPVYDASIVISAHNKIGVVSNLFRVFLTDGKIDAII